MKSANSNGQHRDLVVIGASAGGVEALKVLMAGLPVDFPAAIVVTLHLSPHGRSQLANILNRVSPLRASNARNGEAIECGHVYLGVPDHHVLIQGHRLRLGRGPKENGTRPAIDVLFRSAAADYGPRVVGVLLTGSLDDGTAGFVAIKQRLGVTVAQDPTEALFPSMPRSAIENATVDHVIRMDRLASLLQRLVTEPIPRTAVPPVPDQMRREIEMAGGTMNSRPEQAVGQPSGFGCPDCGGPLNQVEEGGTVRFRCHVGHAWSQEGLAAVQSSKVEEALWIAIRWLDEEETLSAFGAERARRRDSENMAAFFDKRAAQARQRSTILRDFLNANAMPLPETDETPAPEREQFDPEIPVSL